MPNPSSLPTITMTIKRQFFAEILALRPRKKIEYREMKPYWDTRLEAVLNKLFKLRLLNGMTPPALRPPSWWRGLFRPRRPRSTSYTLEKCWGDSPAPKRNNVNLTWLDSGDMRQFFVLRYRYLQPAFSCGGPPNVMPGVLMFLLNVKDLLTNVLVVPCGNGGICVEVMLPSAKRTGGVNFPSRPTW